MSCFQKVEDQNLTKVKNKIFETPEIEYQKLLGYSKTRWLALIPVIERVFQLYVVCTIFILKHKKMSNSFKEILRVSKFWMLEIFYHVKYIQLNMCARVMSYSYFVHFCGNGQRPKSHPLSSKALDISILLKYLFFFL